MADSIVMAKKRDEALALYIDRGWSLRRIAAELGIGKATVERWSASAHWKIHRLRAWNNRREEIIKRQVTTEALRDRTIAGQLYALLQDAIFDHRAFYEGKLPKRAIRYSTAELCRIARALSALGESDLRKAIYQDIRPSARGSE